MAADEQERSMEQLLDRGYSSTGLLSYIRLGRPRRAGDFSSSPVISADTGDYVSDFLNWGLTAPHSLQTFSSVTANDTDIVPFSHMDQGRLFVRVSVKDLATLQLAYQKGLAALQRSQLRIERLREENEKLKVKTQEWSLKTTELNMETIRLTQEIASLKNKIITGSIGLDEHDELIALLCHNICHTMHGEITTHNWQASSFNDLLKLVCSLPLKLHEKLANTCPNFDKLLNSTEPTTIVLAEAQTNVERILQLLPPDVESAFINALMKKFENRKNAAAKVATDKTEKDLSKSSSEQRVSPSSSGEIKEDDQPETQIKRYSMAELNLLTQISSSSRGDDADAVDRLDSLVFGKLESTNSSEDKHTTNNNASPPKQPINAEVKVRNPGTIYRKESRSQCSSIGTPLAQSTPLGTLSNLVSPKHQLKLTAVRKRRKRKKSRWNFAAKICSSGRSTTMSDSESMESAMHLQTRPKVKVITHHGRSNKGYKWLFNINKH